MKNIYLFQPQYKMIFNNIITYWLPYSISCIWSYVAQYKWVNRFFELKDIVFSRENVDLLVDRVTQPSICAFSVFIWNEQWCLKAAKHIKSKWPDCIIVFGGAQIDETFSDNNFIDVLIIGPGEDAFLNLLNLVLNKKPLPQIIKGNRLKDLNDLPSPYLTGLFDNILVNNSSAVWQMTLETDRGCPFGCTFCNWGCLINSEIKKFKLDRVKAEIDWASNNPITYIFCADANFGIFEKRALDIAEYMSKKLSVSMVDVVCLQYTKNNNKAMVDIAKKMGRLSRGISLSAQSMNSKTLSAINRANLSSNKLSEVIDLAHQYDISTYTELILGLPEETVDSWRDGIDRLLDAGQHQSIEVLTTQLFNNSELSSKASRDRYGIKTIRIKDFMAIYNDPDDVSEYVDIVKKTNSMTTGEMIDCYMYSWMIVNFHISGFTAIIAKECRNNGIKYRIFYDYLYEKIKKSNIFSKQYLFVKNSFKKYLTIPHGSLRQSSLYEVSYDFIYKNKEEAFQLAMNSYEYFLKKKNDTIKQMQEAYIYDENHTYPISISYKNKDYVIDCWLKNRKNVFALRRRGGLYKNKLMQKHN